MSRSGCGAYLTRSSRPVLQPAHLSPLPAHHWPVCATCSCSVRLLPFRSAFALRWGEGPSFQLPSTLSFDTKKEGWAPRRLRSSWALIAAYRNPHHLHMRQTGLEGDLSYVRPSKRALARISLSPGGG
ncbi:hypothetical protein H8959_005097 [Pygathrix nigripes]